ncbi:PucR family transcriptional regulator [Nocardiopsis exhalans]|uniref:PucR family transcriptional regulator n=1 Tax=Nocardiopsis exhalans TaxID=163604 RepID=A0ABY5D1X8_9ACTN|nr:PucR family transcriptional regulator [Nocardiopsis exhalans]USY17187.1 PucR family transcriptional regulator [Nocardiopsis exhalans]
MVDGTGGADSHDVPLSVVTGRRDLALTTVVAAGDPAITWAVASEMVEPAAYLRGGELLLTAGVNLPATAAGVRAYVDSLVRTGVGAIGFGVAPVYDTIPERLIEQCHGQGLPLLEVPQATPFAAVSRAVGEELEERHLRDVRRLGEAHQALARAVTATAPVQRVLSVLADSLGAWAALEPSDPGTPAHRTTGAPRSTDPELRPLIAKLTDPAGPRGAKAPSGTDEVFLHTVGVPPQERGVVLVGRPEPLGITDRAVLRTATALLDLLSRTVEDAPPVPGRLLTGLLLDGGLDESTAPLLAELTDTRGRAGASGAYRVLRARPLTQDRRTAPGDLPLGTHLVDRAGPDADADAGECVRAVLADRGEQTHREHLDLLRAHGWIAALSAPALAPELPEADRRAAALLVRARASGEPLLWGEGTDPFAVLLDPAGTSGLRRELLGPLARDTGAARTLRETLRVWLARHGNWDRAAADLGVHRNSVRYRIGRIERDLGVDLADAEQRMRLWFALTRGPDPH